MRIGLRIGAVITTALLLCVGCAPAAEDEPRKLGEDYPGTCLPGSLTWPTDFLDGLYGEDFGIIDGEIVGLRLEYVDDQWAWRLRSRAHPRDWSGDPIDDPTAGMESLVTTRDLQLIRSRDVTLTEAEQQPTGTGAWAAAKASGEKWPSPLVIDMSRVMDDGRAAWQITTCDTATNRFTEQIL